MVGLLGIALMVAMAAAFASGALNSASSVAARKSDWPQQQLYPQPQQQYYGGSGSADRQMRGLDKRMGTGNKRKRSCNVGQHINNCRFSCTAGRRGSESLPSVHRPAAGRLPDALQEQVVNAYCQCRLFSVDQSDCNVRRRKKFSSTDYLIKFILVEQ